MDALCVPDALRAGDDGVDDDKDDDDEDDVADDNDDVLRTVL